ncbi:hypothetical protein [Agathobacter rectalis]|uniref:Uncharacterized protein n=1 Tax=Agathobacter rectalis TaxID=39491 RepID=A0A3E4YKY6_9FIRM|nr:hypothetical protein [Agathobacter rectalis]RGM75437.1 hypothetical protein DXB99_02635 [Agathobacter rectalis]
MWVASCIILIGAISLACSLVLVFALDDDKEYKDKTIFLLKIVIISLLLLAIGISGRIYIHHNQISKIKAIIAKEYPDAVDFKIDKDRPLGGKFDYNGAKYIFKEIEAIKGKNILYISQDGQKSDDVKIINMND